MSGFGSFSLLMPDKFLFWKKKSFEKRNTQYFRNLANCLIDNICEMYSQKFTYSSGLFIIFPSFIANDYQQSQGLNFIHWLWMIGRCFMADNLMGNAMPSLHSYNFLTKIFLVHDLVPLSTPPNHYQLHPTIINSTQPLSTPPNHYQLHPTIINSTQPLSTPPNHYQLHPTIINSTQPLFRSLNTSKYFKNHSWFKYIILTFLGFPKNSVT